MDTTEEFLPTELPNNNEEEWRRTNNKQEESLNKEMIYY